MDHSMMDHSAMGHDMPTSGEAQAMCSMSMLFTWNTQNLCIIFKWWHVRSTAGLIVSLLAIVALTAAYEAIRAGSRRYEAYANRKQEEVPRRNQIEVSKRAHIIKAALYAFQSFYAFMLMLLFMTYNGWVMISVAIGSFVGFLLFGNNTSATKDSACH